MGRKKYGLTHLTRVQQDQSTNEAFSPGTRFTRMTPATHWRAEKSTTFLLASVLTCLLHPGSGTYRFALPVCPAPWMDAEQILTAWNISSHWDTQNLHRSSLELLCESCTHSSMPFWEFPKKTYHQRQLSLDLQSFVKDTVL